MGLTNYPSDNTVRPRPQRAAAVSAGIVILTIVSITTIVPLALNVTRSLARAQFISSVRDVEGATSPLEHPLVVYLGNSFIGGSSQDSGPTHRWPALVSNAVNATSFVLADGGSGYTVPGALGLTFGDLAEQVPACARLVVVLGSDDDEFSSYSDTVRATTDALTAVKKHAPHAHVLAIATLGVDTNPDEGILTSRDAVRTAAENAEVSFVDPISDHWLGPDPKKYTGDDGLHPTDQGHQVLADIITPIVKSELAEPAP